VKFIILSRVGTFVVAPNLLYNLHKSQTHNGAGVIQPNIALFCITARMFNVVIVDSFRSTQFRHCRHIRLQYYAKSPARSLLLRIFRCCVFVCWSRPCEPYKHSRIDLDAVWGQTRMVPSNHVLDGAHIGTTWRIRGINLCSGGDAACRYHYCQHYNYYVHKTHHDRHVM